MKSTPSTLAFYHGDHAANLYTVHDGIEWLEIGTFPTSVRFAGRTTHQNILDAFLAQRGVEQHVENLESALRRLSEWVQGYVAAVDMTDEAYDHLVRLRHALTETWDHVEY